jgi:D-arabinose 1-dehydrogenase-like Zn-dependent alcohol dehydrogenase
MAKMRAIQISKPKGPFEMVEREIPKAGPGQVRIKVQACGICHSDSFVVEGLFPGIQYPRVPGHEVAGIIDEIGEGVTGFKKGQKVGVGWNGGYCETCLSCRRGDFALCENLKISGISYDGGYAEYMVAPANALAIIPDEISAIEAGPMMCAGITTYNSLRHSGAKPGDVVAILGVGGLGHFAVQFASKMGFYTVAIARGKNKEALAKELGAKAYIDSEAENPAEALKKLGGARVILATVTSAKAMDAVVNGLSADGLLMVVGATPEPLQVSPLTLIMKRLSVMGWPCGSPLDSQDTMCFCKNTGVRSMNQVFPMEKAKEAYDLMMSGKARFRVVLDMQKH